VGDGFFLFLFALLFFSFALELVIFLLLHDRDGFCLFHRHTQIPLDKGFIHPFHSLLWLASTTTVDGGTRAFSPLLPLMRPPGIP
jgi:hypothetical protein